MNELRAWLSVIIPGMNFIVIVGGGLFGLKLLSDGVREAMELIKQIQAQHQLNSERISRLEGIVNHR